LNICQKRVEKPQRTSVPRHASCNIFTTTLHGVGREGVSFSDVMFFRRLLTWGRLFVDLWYAAEDANARPPSLVGAVEVRWRGSVVGSQETKRRLFSEKTSAVEWARVGYVVSRSAGRTVPIMLLNPMQLFQDHSMAWYRVMWKVRMCLYRGSGLRS